MQIVKPCEIFQEDKQSLEIKLKKTEEDLSRQLAYAQQVYSSLGHCTLSSLHLLGHQQIRIKGIIVQLFYLLITAVVALLNVRSLTNDSIVLIILYLRTNLILCFTEIGPMIVLQL
jgi:hypothetical protein